VISTLDDVQDPNATTGAYDTQHYISSGAVTHLVDPSFARLSVELTGESASDGTLTLHGWEISWVVPGGGSPTRTFVALDRRLACVCALQAAWGLRTRA